MLKKFLHSVLPSMLAFAFSSLYTIVDGFFIGRGVGDVGLAGIGIAFPAAALIQAVGTGIGMGGAVSLSISRGKGDEESENRFLGNTLTLLGSAAVLLTELLLVFHRPLLSLLGAEGQVLEAGASYLKIIGIGTVFQLFATGFTPLLRNYGAATPAMAAMVSGFLTNIALDALFVSALGFGMAGAAWATVIGQAVTLLACAGVLWKRVSRLPRRAFRLRAKYTPQILKTGLSPFGLSMSPNIITILMNIGAMAYGGETAVAAFAVISYVIAIVILMLQGVGDGSQPLMSLYLGRSEAAKAKKVRNLAYLFAGITGFLLLGSILWLGPEIPCLFGASAGASALAAQALPPIAAGVALLAFSRVTTSYFYSVEKNVRAYCLVYGESLLLLLSLFFLPPIFGLWGVWLALPLSHILITIFGALLLAGAKQPLPLQAPGQARQ